MSIAKAASKCYDSEPTPELVNKVLGSGHTSMAEFAVFHFEISEVSRALTHQLVRKRIGISYAQRSQRYVNEYNFDYVVPPSIRAQNFIDKYVNLVEQIGNLYSEMIEKGIPKEDARYILPNATHTVIDIEINLRSLMDLAYERMCERSQWEIRNMVREMRHEIISRWPILGEFIKPKCMVLGYCPEHKSCGLTIRKKDVKDLFRSGKENS